MKRNVENLPYFLSTANNYFLRKRVLAGASLLMKINVRQDFNGLAFETLFHITLVRKRG